MSERIYIDELSHHGIKGQKWGVRRYQNKDGSLTPAGKRRYDVDRIVEEREKIKLRSTTSRGSDVLLDHNHTPAFTKFLARHNEKVKNTLENSKSFKIKVGGKIVGEMDLYKESPDSLNVVWVGVNRSHEGNGYGTAAMKGAINYARKTGCKHVTLEVPGNSPNARHVYEKLGFKETGVLTTADEDPAWGGLTAMRLDLNDEGVNSVNELNHHGIKGQKWGVRRYQNKDGTLTEQGIKRYAKKGYAQDALSSNKTAYGKAWDKVTGSHKISADIRYGVSSKKENKARAEQYVADKEARKQKAVENAKKKVSKETAAKLAGKGAEIAAKAALVSAVDDIFYGGIIKSTAKMATREAGRAVVTAFVMANGGHDIHWYDT